MIYWRNAYNLNIPAIDSERKLFFSVLNKIDSISFNKQREFTADFINEFLESTRLVFKQEENILKNIDCPSNIIKTQNKEHIEFIEKMSELSSDKFLSTLKFIDLLKTFIINHIIGSDLDYAFYVQPSSFYTFHNSVLNESILTKIMDVSTLIKWNSYLELGISEIDEQHHHFVHMINDLALNYTIYTHSDLIGLTNNLRQYTIIHFETEEKLMKELNNYPNMNKHIEQHNKFIKYVKSKTDIIKEMDEHFDIESESVLKILIKWLVQHIAKIDKEFGIIYHKEHI